MRKLPTYLVSGLGALALIASVTSYAAASRPRPLRAENVTKRDSTVNGNLAVNKSASVTGNLQVGGNADVYQRLTAHGGLRLFGGLDVRSGGIKTGSLTLTGHNGLTVQAGGVKTDSLVTGGISADNVTIHTNLQAGAIDGASLQINGGATVNGGLDTGTGGLTTGSINDTGPASVKGNQSISGSLSVAGSSGITAARLQGPTVAGGNGPGALSLQGSAIALNGDMALLGGSDLALSAGSGATASHIVANGDTDVSGSVTVNVPAGSAAGTAATASYSFRKNYASEPSVTLTPVGDPAPGSNSMPKYWVVLVTGSSGGSTVYTGFDVHFVTPVAIPDSPSAGFNAQFDYHVVGS